MNFTTAAKPELNECGKRPLESADPLALDSLIHIFERSHRRDNILADIGLGNKKRVRRDFQRPNLAGGDDDVNRRPPVSYRSGQFQPIHGAGHVDIGKNEVDILTGFENGDRLVGIGSQRRRSIRPLRVLPRRVP